jgi:uncharacterized LabA/DUF88 family protein
MNENSIYIFIDASNLWQAQKTKGRFLDYQKVSDFIKNKHNGTSVKVFYYTAYPANGTRKYDLVGKHNFFTYLKKGLGFDVKKKVLKRISVTDEFGESVIEKGNMDVEMVIDAIHYSDKFNTAVFFSGDSDFLALVNYLRNKTKKVFIYSSENNISQELRTGADGYVDILKIKDDIWGRELKRRTDI